MVPHGVSTQLKVERMDSHRDVKMKDGEVFLYILDFSTIIPSSSFVWLSREAPKMCSVSPLKAFGMPAILKSGR